MKFGICSTSKLVKMFGADYSELCAYEVSAMKNDEYSALLASVKNGEIVTYSSNGLLPSDMRITGEVDKARVREYVDKTLYRLRELGISMVVFGSADAKNVPSGFPMEKAWDQLFEFGGMLTDVAEKNGQTVAVEPLNYTEVNIVNTVKEGAYYVNTVNRSSFRLLVDFYHLSRNNEDLSVVSEYGDLLAHIHIASRERGIPESAEDKAYVTACIRKLKEIGYKGRISYEGKTTPQFDGVREMLELYRSV